MAKNMTKKGKKVAKQSAIAVVLATALSFACENAWVFSLF